MPARYPSDCPAGYLSHYFVIPGDTMSIIAQRFGISSAELIAVNPHIDNPNVLFVGDVLCVPGFRKPDTCPSGFTGRYEVQIGDTIFLIAQRYNVTVEKLAAANPHIPNVEMIFPFDVLCVPQLVD